MNRAPRPVNDGSPAIPARSPEGARWLRASALTNARDDSGALLQRQERIALTVALVIAFLAAAWVAAPLYAGILLGTAMAFTAYPVFGWLTHRLRGSRRAAAALTTALGASTMLGGGALAVFLVVREIVSLEQSFPVAHLDAPVPGLGAAVRRLGLNPDVVLAGVHDQILRLQGMAADGAAMAVSASTSAIIATVIALFTMYYVIMDWPRLSARIERVLPLKPAHTRALMDEFRVVARTAFVGTLATGMIQGVLAGIGFALAGVRGALVLGAVSAVASFVPVFGPSLVWGPVAGALLLNHHPTSALFTVVWGLALVMAAADYLIRPNLVGGTRDRHPLLVLLGVLGGLQIFGITGLIAGPVLMSLFVAVLRIYEREQDRGES